MSSKSTPEPDELGRALAAAEHWGQVNIAQSDKIAEVGMSWAWDLASVARTALRETGRVAQLEAELTTASPQAAARFKLIGDVAAVALAAVIAHTARTMLTDPADDDRSEGEQ